MPEYIYKVLDRQLWESAVSDGRFQGAEIDLQDGYIHFSAAHQVQETVRKHFAGRENLVLVEVAPATLGSALRWEVSRGGDKFPHLYAELATSSVHAVYNLPLGADREHVFPEHMTAASDNEPYQA